MNTSILTLLPSRQKVKILTLFGYSSRGLPGLEIVGLGVESRKIKEKLVYLCRDLGIRLPPKRYVLCFEGDIKKLQKENQVKYLELPLFVLFLTLAEQLPIHKLDDCLCFGELRINGEYLVPPIEEDYWLFLDKVLLEKGKKIKVIYPRYFDDMQSLYFLPLEEILSSLRQVEV